MINFFKLLRAVGTLLVVVGCLLVWADSRWASGQAVPPLEPPKWSVGDYWKVECEVYDSGKIVKGPVNPGWRAKQTWLFQVEGMENIQDQPYFVVSIKPQGDNKCPYWFRYWFRETDRHIGRQELHHQSATGGKSRSIGPPVVRKDFPPDAPSPFFADNFPSLPLTTPLFNTDQSLTPFSPRKGISAIYQEVDGTPALNFMSGAEAPLLKKDAPAAPPGNRLVKIIATANKVEQQVWNPGHPWCVYGERAHQGKPSRRYWLVESGRVD